MAIILPEYNPHNGRVTMGNGGWLEPFVFGGFLWGGFVWSKQPFVPWVGTGADRWSICTWFEQDDVLLPFQIVIKA